MPRLDRIEVTVQLASLAIATLLDYLKEPPKSEEERKALDSAALTLITKTSEIADAVRDRLGVPDTTSVVVSTDPLQVTRSSD